MAVVKLSEKFSEYDKARIFLARYRSITGRIEHLRRTILSEEERIRLEYDMLSAPIIDGVYAKNKKNVNTDGVVNHVIMIEERLRKSLENMQADLCQLEYQRDEADEVLRQVPWTPDERTVIELYYLLPETKANWQIAMDMNYSERTVNNLKRSAIGRLAEIGVEV